MIILVICLAFLIAIPIALTQAMLGTDFPQSWKIIFIITIWTQWSLIVILKMITPMYKKIRRMTT